MAGAPGAAGAPWDVHDAQLQLAALQAEVMRPHAAAAYGTDWASPLRGPRAVMASPGGPPFTTVWDERAWQDPSRLERAVQNAWAQVNALQGRAPQ